VDGRDEGPLVGEDEGSLEGDVDGRDEGPIVGEDEGSFEGDIDGEDEGLFEGDIDGIDEGSFEGDIDGTDDGLFVGKDEGSLEGDFDGKDEGSLEGDFDGKDEGSLEGDVVGIRDGALDGYSGKGMVTVAVTSIGINPSVTVTFALNFPTSSIPIKIRSNTPSAPSSKGRVKSSKSSPSFCFKVAVILLFSASSAFIRNVALSPILTRAFLFILPLITGAVFLRIVAVSFSTTASVVVDSTSFSSLVAAKSKMQAS